MITSAADIQYAALKTVSPDEIASEALREEIQKAWADQEPTLTYHIMAWNDRRETA